MNDKQWTIGTILAWTRQYFGDKGIDNARLDAEVLLSTILGKDRLYLYVNFDQPLLPEELAEFRAAVIKRAKRIPVAYITGIKEFMGLGFHVNPDVLIPRPDTEILVETMQAELKDRENPLVLDIGAGSGAVIVSLLHGLPRACGVAVDVSPAAVSTTILNAKRLGVAERLTAVQGDIFSAVKAKKFAAIVSNPPYIASADIESLAPEVKTEPRLALDGGVDGLDFYRKIVAAAADYLLTDGLLAFEVGMGQALAVADLCDSNSGLKLRKIVKDYSGIERVVVIERR